MNTNFSELLTQLSDFEERLHRNGGEPVPDPRRAIMAELLQSIFGSECWDDSVDQTARRVLKYWYELATPADNNFEFTTFPADKGQMIVVDNIEFSSACAHHLMPFYGKAHVAYIPNELQVGLSKVPRLVQFWAHRPQVQERLTHQIAHDMKERLKPMGVMVVIVARHTCQSCRGVRNHNGSMKTSLPMGVFMSNPAARDEFFRMLSLDV